MTAVVLALGPIFLLILLGFFIKSRKVISDAFWQPAETLTYYIFFPALLVVNTATADLSGLSLFPLAASLVCAVLIVSGITLALRPGLRTTASGFTSIFQGAIRPNTYVGIAAAASLYGDPGLTLTAICIVFVVPLVNLLSVSILVRLADDASVKRHNIFIEIAKNPIIFACALGGLINLSGVGLPPIVGALLEILGRAALPIGLLAVGAGLNLSAVKKDAFNVTVATLLKLLAIPTVTLLGGLVFGLEGITLSVGLIYAAIPTSASSYVLARQMGGDATLMAGIITASTLAAVVTMPLSIILVDWYF